MVFRHMMMLSALATVAADAQAPEALAVDIDTRHVVEGERIYRLLRDGEEVGAMHYRLHRDGGRILIDEETTMQPDVRETTQATLAAETYMPMTLRVDGEFGAAVQQVEVDWDGETLVGWSYTRLPDGREQRKTLDQTVPSGTFERASVFALAAAMPLEEGAEYPFHWFNASTGQVHRVELTVSDGGDIRVPAGDFATFRVDLIGGVPSNVLYVTRETPRRIVRIDVIDAPFVFELLK